MWIMLKNTIEAACLDLRACLLTLSVPFNLIEVIETLEWIIRTKPTNPVMDDAVIVTVRDMLTRLNDGSNTADDYGYSKLRDRIRSNVNSIRPVLIGFELCLLYPITGAKR